MDDGTITTTQNIAKLFDNRIHRSSNYLSLPGKLTKRHVNFFSRY